jgi:hypothetical protein
LTRSVHGRTRSINPPSNPQAGDIWEECDATNFTLYYWQYHQTLGWIEDISRILISSSASFPTTGSNIAFPFGVAEFSGVLIESLIISGLTVNDGSNYYNLSLNSFGESGNGFLLTSFNSISGTQLPGPSGVAYYRWKYSINTAVYRTQYRLGGLRLANISSVGTPANFQPSFQLNIRRIR